MELNGKKPTASSVTFSVDTTPFAVKVFVLQRRLLQLFGFLPSRLWRFTLLRIVWLLISAVVFAGATTELGYQLAKLVRRIQTKAPEDNLVLIFLSYAPYIAESMRGLFVLLLLLAKRNSWQKVADFVDQVVRESMPDPVERDRKIRKWRNCAIVFAVLAIVLHLAWEVAAFFGGGSSDENLLDDVNSTTSKTVSHNITAENLSLTWRYALSSTAESITFCLSQQIFAVLIVLAFVMKTGATVLNQRITATREETEAALDLRDLRTSGPMDGPMVIGWEMMKQHEHGPELMAEVTGKVVAIQEFHLRLVLLSHDINDIFGWILFTLYGMDVVVLIGYVALLVTNESGVAEEKAFFGFSILLFGCFATVLYIPLVQAHEEAAEVTFGLRRLIGVTARLEPRETVLQKRLEVFCTASRRHVPIFEGAELIHITRIPCTMTVSIAVLAYEVLNKAALL
ncbi:hypothetical protein BV898_14265 [Hypsibius exemplaris]|uniref:Gustatory receptor n=1 Tax=Hypsibius exemplaris TaxID=2072580 RepID=A0A1W0W898_HYPEX|nr:hypothetical protein BV898_14265 [Hypsibius exemplaris]